MSEQPVEARGPDVDSTRAEHHEALPKRKDKLSGLRALSAEDKTRIGNLIKVLAQERKDKEELKLMLDQQVSRMQDLEQEHANSKHKEAKLAGRIARSLKLLKSCQMQSTAARRGQREDRGAGAGCPSSPENALKTGDPREAEDDGIDRRNTGNEDAILTAQKLDKGNASVPRNALQDAEPVQLQDAVGSRQPSALWFFSLKPPQLSLLQRYLSIQESPAADMLGTSSGPLPKRQQTPERARPCPPSASLASPERADASVQTPCAASPPRLNTSSTSPRQRNESLMDQTPMQAQAWQTPALSQSPEHIQTPDHRLQLEQALPRRWRQRRKMDELSEVNPYQASPQSPQTPQTPPPSRSRILEPEPLLGSPLSRPPSPPRPYDEASSHGNLGNFSWPAPLRLESYYAPNMFDVIDSLECGAADPGAGKDGTKPALITEDLRRLQRELAAIEHRVHSQSSRLDVPTAHRAVIYSQLHEGEPSPEKQVRQHELELSREVDDVLLLLQEKT